MPKVKWGISNDEPDELEGYDVYDGPALQVGVYDFVLQRLTLKENKNKDDMLNGLLVVKTKDPEKRRFNGATVWFNQNITDQGKPYVLQFLKSLGLTWRDFVGGTVTEDDGRPTKITKIGKVKFNDGAEPMLRASIKMGRAQGEYPSRPEVGQFLAPKDASDAEWDDSGDGDDEDEDDLFGE